MFPYACSTCGGEARVSSHGDVSRACGHDDAAVIAERTSVLYGRSGVATPSLINRAVAALQRLAGAG